jgi:hypothetical protein
MECLNGTNNPGGLTPNPYYFPDAKGLTFFDRIEGKTNDTSQGPTNAKMSTFIIGDPLAEDHNFNTISALDHEYFNTTPTPGNRTITVFGGTLRDPENSIFYLSTYYFTNIFGLSPTYS